MSDRVPYAERPDVIERHCTCQWVWSETQDTRTPKRQGMYYANPTCPLHGGHAKEAPY
jgi:hypothetical protein